MAIKFVLMVNKQGQTRLAEYFEFHSIEERAAMESEIIRKCLSRTELLCSFMEYRGMKVIYRRYASLFFIVGVDQDDVVRVEEGRGDCCKSSFHKTVVATSHRMNWASWSSFMH
jgi:hypothetical protein